LTFWAFLLEKRENDFKEEGTFVEKTEPNSFKNTMDGG